MKSKKNICILISLIILTLFILAVAFSTTLENNNLEVRNYSEVINDVAIDFVYDTTKVDSINNELDCLSTKNSNQCLRIELGDSALYIIIEDQLDEEDAFRNMGELTEQEVRNYIKLNGFENYEIFRSVYPNSLVGKNSYLLYFKNSTNNSYSFSPLVQGKFVSIMINNSSNEPLVNFDEIIKNLDFTFQ